ncbi:MAG: TldD/PmbA family protein [Firmicutes bacterium]|nr:TldD/PmbA family protein [Bacillota bacterium]MBQ5960150.1 TldD/PmbA family protein [Bacillota bacterium]
MNADKWIARAHEIGLDELEIYEQHETEREVSWFEGKVDSFVTSRILGTSLRATLGGKIAEISLEQTDDGMMDSVLESLKEQAETVTGTETICLRKPQDTVPVQNSRTFTRPSMDQIRSAMQETEKKILAADPRIFMVSEIEWQDTKTSVQITNSLGLHVEDAGAAQVFVAGCAARQDDQVKNDYCIRVVEDIEKLDIDDFVKELTEGVLGKLGGTSVPTGSYKVILEKKAMTSLFSAMIPMFSGEDIGKGISPLAGKLGQQIFSDKITVVDDPRCLDALNVRNYDDEGCPTRRKVLVDKGVFSCMLHDTKSSMAAGTESTGNGFKHSYTSPVHITPYNCCILPGERTLDELCAEMGEGIVITSFAGLHAGIDHVTADFSLQCAGYYVKNGVKDHSVTLITAAGNFFDMMKNVTETASDLEWSYRTITCPSVAFRSLSISGT